MSPLCSRGAEWPVLLTQCHVVSGFADSAPVGRAFAIPVGFDAPEAFPMSDNDVFHRW